MDTKYRDQYRFFLKDTIRKQIDFSQTDQSRGVPPPPVEKPFPPTRSGSIWPLRQVAGDPGDRPRERHRQPQEPPRLPREAARPWTSCRSCSGRRRGSGRAGRRGHAFRTVPSAGCRHALETYLCVLRGGLEPGVYRYLPLEHQLLLERADENGRRRSSSGHASASPSRGKRR